MCKLIKFNRSVKRYGLKTRQVTPGREDRLLCSFLKRYVGSLTGEYDYAIFIEPRIPIGCPDCVVVKYDAGAYAAWSKSRTKLSDSDMKVLFYTMRAKRRRVAEIAKRLCICSSAVKQSLGRLVSNGDLVVTGDGWVSTATGARIGVREIISIEAKVHDWRKVTEQAALNRSFATTSYILMPPRKVSAAMREYVTNAGVGMYVYSEELGIQQVLSGRRCNSFRSYLPLYFNEWIGWRLNADRRRSHG